MFNDRDDFLSRVSDELSGRAIMNLIDSINERIIVEYDGSNGILTLRRHDLLFWQCGLIFVRSEIDSEASRDTEDMSRFRGKINSVKINTDRQNKMPPAISLE